jgi:hypothetical protein
MSEGHDRYLAETRTRLRFASFATWGRASGLQILWLSVVLAGAGIPLNRALGGPSWVDPTLGFVVVAAAGIEKIFSRTTPAAVARDRLRRHLERERRRFEAGIEEYADRATASTTFVERVEAIISRYDEEMLEYGRASASS